MELPLVTTKERLELRLQVAVRHEQAAWEVFQAAAEKYRIARQHLLEVRERLASFSGEDAGDTADS